MKLEHISPEKLKQDVRHILGKYLDLSVYKPFFFGSRVAGTNDERADIDVGVDGPAPIPAEKKLAIEEELENLPVLYKIDLVDFATVSDDFRRVALQHVEYIQ